MMVIGILPTVTERHLNAESFSHDARYALLNEQIFAARGEDLHISIAGVERLSTYADTIAPEAACTSVCRIGTTLDLRRLLERVAGHRRRPGGGGRQLPALLRQGAVARDAHRPVRAGDRHPAGGAEGPGSAVRVWFGERWITSIFDLFEENVRYFPRCSRCARRRTRRRR